MTDNKRPKAGGVEERKLDLAVEGRRIRGRIPYSTESRDLGGWREVIEPGALDRTALDDLVATIDHQGVPVGRYPSTLSLEDRSDGLHWSLDPPESRADLREAVERGDLRAGSWRMVVGKDEWRGDVRHIKAISELKDVAIVSNPSYPSAQIEYRSAPTNNAADGPQEVDTSMDADKKPETVEDRSEPEAREAPEKQTEEERSGEKPSGGLQVEDRTAKADSAEDADFDVRRRCSRCSRSRSERSGRWSAANSSLSPADLSSTLFQRLRASSIALQSGIPVISTDRETISWPKLSADVSPAFYSEGGTITPGDPTFETISSVPQKIAHIVEVSNELIDDSEPPAVQVLSDHLSTTLALKLDSAVYMGGTALPGITGFNSLSGVQTGGTLTTSGVAGTASYTAFLDAVGKLRGANAPEPYVAALNPATWTSLQKVQDTTGQPLQFPEGTPAVYTSTQITGGTTNGVGFVYSPSQFAIVSRQDASVEVDRSRLFNSDQSEIRGKLRANFVAVNAGAAVKLTAT